MRQSRWEAIFPSHIWQRGLDYYRRGHVLHIEQEENEVTAEVEGSELYTVSVLFDPETGAVEDFDCDCPYAEDGTPCKHLAAVLCALEDGFSPKDKPTLAALIDRLTPEQMRDLLLRTAKTDRNLREQIRRIAERPEPGTTQEEWEQDLADLTVMTRDPDGFIGYDKAYDYCCALAEYLEDRLPPLLTDGEWEDAFELTCTVFSAAMAEDMDDSDGGMTMLAELCMNTWSAILMVTDLQAHREIFRWLAVHCNDGTMGEEFLPDYILEAPWEEGIRPQLLKYLDGEIERYQKAEFGRYHLPGLIARRLEWTEQGEIDAFIAEHRHLSAVRDLLIDRALERGEDVQALALLREGKELDGENKDQAEHYSRRELEIYTRRNMARELRQALEAYLFTFSQHDLKYVDRLKAMLTSEEWEVMRERLLNSSTMAAWRNALLAQEELYERLMDEIEKKGDIHGLDQYETLLRERFPERCVRLLVDWLHTAMDRSYDRNGYRMVVQVLRKLRRYSETEAKTMAAEWKMKYPRRTAMLDELEMAGF